MGLYKVFEDGCKNSSEVNGTYCLVAISKIYIAIQSSTAFKVCAWQVFRMFSFFL